MRPSPHLGDPGVYQKRQTEIDRNHTVGTCHDAISTGGSGPRREGSTPALQGGPIGERMLQMEAIVLTKPQRRKYRECSRHPKKFSGTRHLCKAKKGSWERQGPRNAERVGFKKQVGVE